MYAEVMWRSNLRFLLPIIVAVAACNPAATQPTGVPTSAPAPETLRLALASSDLAVGSNRVVFGVIDPDTGAVNDAAVQVSTFFLTPTGEQQGPIETVDATFRAWPVTPRGVFTAQPVSYTHLTLPTKRIV